MMREYETTPSFGWEEKLLDLCEGVVSHNKEPSLKTIRRRKNFQIPELLAPHVCIRDVAQVEKKIANFFVEGKDNLQVIADFDKTLTRYHYKGELTKITHGVFSYVKELPSNFLKETNILYAKVSGVLMDNRLTEEEKQQQIEQLYNAIHRLFIGIHISDELMTDAIVISDVKLREGVEEVMNKLKENNVPVLILSAGLGNILTSILKLHSISLDNIHVISNFFSVNKGIIQGFKGKNITMLNKSKYAIENCDYFEEFSHRKNVILLGDTIGDAGMDEGVKGEKTVLKIGFLNTCLEEDLPKFMALFDIVLQDDSTVNVFNAILKKIFNK